MAGQQQILIINQEALYDKAHEDLLKQADLYYLKEKFALKTDFDKRKLRHSQIMEQVLCTTNCELMDWLWKKINGKLDKTRRKRKVKDLNVLRESNPDINIYNIFNEESTWEETQW